jgi:hypothetical protein
MTIIAPPFNLESGTQKVRLAEDGWNSRDPGKVSLALRRTAVGGTAPLFPAADPSAVGRGLSIEQRGYS